MQSKPHHRTSAASLASIGCVLLGAIACGSEPAEVALSPIGSDPVLVDTAPVVYEVPDGLSPAHEGTVVMAGRYPVEVVPHASGEVYAYVLGDEPPPPSETELAVVVPVAGGVRTVELEWDVRERRWGGRVRTVAIVPGPVDVVLVAEGSRWMGHSTTFVVRPAIVVVPVVVAPSPVIVVQPDYDYAHDEDYDDDHDEGGHHGRHRGWSHGRGHGRGHGIGIRIHH